MKHLRLWAVLLLVVIGTVGVVYRHSFGFFVTAAGSLGGQLLWRMFGRRGRRWLLLPVGIPVALILVALDTLAESLFFPHSFHRAHHADYLLFSGPIWLLSGIFAGWLTNPHPETDGEPKPPQSEG